jgi:hypothetical protein
MFMISAVKNLANEKQKIKNTYNVNQVFIAVNFIQLVTHSRLLVALTLQNAEIWDKKIIAVSTVYGHVILRKKFCQYCIWPCYIKKKNLNAK